MNALPECSKQGVVGLSLYLLWFATNNDENLLLTKDVGDDGGGGSDDDDDKVKNIKQVVERYHANMRTLRICEKRSTQGM